MFFTHLFYSEKENILFYIAGYVDNSCNVDEIIKMLQKNKAKFIKLGGEDFIAWVKENNPAAAKVIQADIDNRTGFTIITNIPEPDPRSIQSSCPWKTDRKRRPKNHPDPALPQTPPRSTVAVVDAL